MKINWKVRFKNRTFVVTFCTVVVAFVYQMLGMFEVVPAVSQDNITQLIMIVVNILAGLGVVVDGTTAGISDSDRAMTYETDHDVRDGE